VIRLRFPSVFARVTRGWRAQRRATPSRGGSVEIWRSTPGGRLPHLFTPHPSTPSPPTPSPLHTENPDLHCGASVGKKTGYTWAKLAQTPARARVQRRDSRASPGARAFRRDGVGMRWLVLTPGSPCAGVFLCGPSHVDSDVLSTLKLPRGVRARGSRGIPMRSAKNFTRERGRGRATPVPLPSQ